MRLIRSLRHLVSALSVLAGITLFGGSAVAQSLFLPADGAAPAAVQAAVPQAIRSRLVRIDANMLARHVAPTNADTATDRVAQADQLDGVVRLNLFDDTIHTFRRKNVKARPDGGFIWSGIVPGRPVHEALLLIRDGRISGRVQLGTRLFRIDPVDGGLQRVTEVNPAAYRPEAPPVVGVQRDGVAPSPQLSQPDIQPHATTTIRVFVAYTSAAANEAASVAHNIKDEIDLAIAQANEAYENGNIPIKLVRAGTMKTTYSEKADITDDLNNLTSGGSLKPVRDQRDPNNADLVSLFRKSDPNFCGIAQLPGGGVMPTPKDATSDFAYSVVARDCVTNLSFHHELGHNMGLQHDRYVYKLQTGDTPGSQFYNFGYINKAENLRTVMAYRDGCPDPNNCTRINWFSSATIRATGNVVIGKPKGDKNAADNTLRLRQTRSAISQYE